MPNTSRREFLQHASVLVGLVMGFAAGALTPRTVLAAWPKQAFEAGDVAAVSKELFAGLVPKTSDQVRIKAPEIAENGTVVPITIFADVAGIDTIALVAEGNPRPLAARYHLGKGAGTPITTRVKLAKTQKITAYVKCGDVLYAATREVKVTIGGCGG